jgi:hypothetical protein
MSEFRTSFEMEIDVSFADPEKAKAYFIDGEWKDSFWEIDDMEELAKYIAHSFHVEGDRYDAERKAIVRSAEGFGDYILGDSGLYHLDETSAEYVGGITVRYEMELEPVDTMERTS